MPQALTLSLQQARRLAVSKQGLAGTVRPVASTGDLLGVVRDLGCLQLDPTAVVERTHLLVLWSRLGGFDRALLESLRWEERRLFEYWAHAASMVLTEDYPLFRPRMRHYTNGKAGWPRAMREWMRANAGFKRYMMGRLQAEGPLRSRDFEDRAVLPWKSEGWTHGRNVNRMLEFMWARGEVVVAGRSGATRWWDLADRWMPAWTPREVLSAKEVTRRSVERSLRALGVATTRQIREHFTRGYYPGLASALRRLEREGLVVRAQVQGLDGADPWFIHAEDVDAVGEEFEPRTTLLSPFDNLICDRARTEALFGFRYRIEIYTPKHKREYGYFAMPILHGDRLIGRVDSQLDRKSRTLIVNSAHAEPGAKLNKRAVDRAIESLGTFAGAERVAKPDG